MGLDMYLFKTKKVAGLTEAEYETIANTISNEVKEEPTPQLDLVQLTNHPKANEFRDEIKKRGEFYTWYSILEEVGYWRKANQIHQWFVKHVQNGVDECQLSMVTKEQLETLLTIAKTVKEDHEEAPKLLPTTSGFFFGSTDYDEWYEQDIDETITIVTNVLQHTDFEKEVVFYQASW